MPQAISLMKNETYLLYNWLHLGACGNFYHLSLNQGLVTWKWLFQLAFIKSIFEYWMRYCLNKYSKLITCLSCVSSNALDKSPSLFKIFYFWFKNVLLKLVSLKFPIYKTFFFLKFYLKNIIKLYFVKVKLLSIIWTYDRYIGLLKKFNRKKYLGRDIWTTERFQLFSRRNYWKSSTLKNT